MVNSVSIPNPYQGSTLIHLNQLPATAPQNHPAISRNGRRRGVVLTQQGWQKMMQAGVLYDDFGKRYTFEELSERSLLDARTVSRILSCEVKVDKRTLKTFFQAFNLQLETGDYTVPGFRVEDRTNSNFLDFKIISSLCGGDCTTEADDFRTLWSGF